MHELEPGRCVGRVRDRHRAAQVRQYYSARDLRVIEARQSMSDSSGRGLLIHSLPLNQGASCDFDSAITQRPPPAEPA